MKHMKTHIAPSVIVFSLLAGHAFAGQPKYMTDPAQTAKAAEYAQRMGGASSLQTLTIQAQPHAKRKARGKTLPNRRSPASE